MNNILPKRLSSSSLRKGTLMKKPTVTAVLAGLATSAYAESYIALDNNLNTNTSSTATASGLFWTSTGGPPALITQDFNVAFYGGANSTNLSLLAAFLLADGTAAQDNAAGSGTFTDPSGKSYPI